MAVNNQQHIGAAVAIARPFLVAKETVRLSAYLDQGKKGIPTIGTGITSYHFAPAVAKRFGRNAVKMGDKITAAENDALREGAIAAFAKGLPPLLKVQLNPNQLAALISLSYNWGLGNFGKSKLLAAINAKKPQAEISKIFEATALTSGGVKLSGLVARRDKEEDLFIKPFVVGSSLVFLIAVALFYLTVIKN